MGRWLLFGLSLGALALFIQRGEQRRDTFLRGYAADQYDTPDDDDAEAFEHASEVAARVGLPLKWVRELQRTVPADRLEHAAAVTKRAWSLPADTTPASLARSREAALAAGRQA